jgi:predicted dehydrogenase
MSGRPYRSAVIGCGRIGSEFADDPLAADWGICTHAGAYTSCPMTSLVAVCDTDLRRAKRCAERWSIPAWYVDPARLLAENPLDVVSVCTPDATHYDVLRMVLLTDGVKAVLAEKPLATSVEQAQELVQLARQRRIVLAVNYSRRYADNHVQLRDFLRADKLGPIRVVRGLYTKGTAHNGTHWFDLARFLVGDVTSVRAVDRLGEGGTDPTLDVHLDFASGAIGELIACCAEEYTIFEMELLGSKGRVRVIESGSAIERYGIIEGRPFTGYRSLVLAERKEGDMRDVLLHAVRDLASCLQEGTAPRCSGDDGLAALHIATAAHTSAASSRLVLLEN